MQNICLGGLLQGLLQPLLGQLQGLVAGLTLGLERMLGDPNMVIDINGYPI